MTFRFSRCFSTCGGRCSVQQSVQQYDSSSTIRRRSMTEATINTTVCLTLLPTCCLLPITLFLVLLWTAVRHSLCRTVCYSGTLNVVVLHMWLCRRQDEVRWFLHLKLKTI